MRAVRAVPVLAVLLLTCLLPAIASADRRVTRPVATSHARLLHGHAHARAAQSDDVPREVPLRYPHPDQVRAAKGQAPGLQARAAQAPAPQSSVYNGLNAAGLGPNGPTPPDPTGSIGPADYIEMVNAKVGLYSRSDLSLTTSAVLDTFTAGTGNAASGDCDPQIQWDQQGGRWFYAAIDCNEPLGTSPGTQSLFFGWSKTADPGSLTSDWCKYVLGTDDVLYDYPKLGHDDTHLLIGANAFSGAGETFVGARVLSMPKPAPGDLSSCAAAPAVSTFNLPSAVASPEPVNTAESVPDGAYVVAGEALSGTNDHLRVFHVSGSPATLTADGRVAVAPFDIPPSILQPGTTNELDSSDGRLTQAVADTDPDAAVADPTGGGLALWTQHTVASTDGARAEVRWYEIVAKDCTASCAPTLRQQGTVGDAASSAFNGAISPAGNGSSAVIFFNIGGSTLLPEIRARTRIATDPQGTMGGELTLGSSSHFDQDFSCAPPNPGDPPLCRWGDYAGASPDPLQQNAVWGTNQALGPASGSSAHWVTRNYAVSPDAAPADPVASTAPATNVTATSATLNGSVNPTGTATSYYFEYGPTLAYGQRTPVRSAGSGSADVPVNEDVAGLTPSTTYHFRIVAVRGLSLTPGSDRAFDTAAAPPTDTGGRGPRLDRDRDGHGRRRRRRDDPRSYGRDAPDRAPDHARARTPELQPAHRDVARHPHHDHARARRRARPGLAARQHAHLRSGGGASGHRRHAHGARRALGDPRRARPPLSEGGGAAPPPALGPPHAARRRHAGGRHAGDDDHLGDDPPRVAADASTRPAGARSAGTAPTSRRALRTRGRSCTGRRRGPSCRRRRCEPSGRGRSAEVGSGEPWEAPSGGNRGSAEVGARCFVYRRQRGLMREVSD